MFFQTHSLFSLSISRQERAIMKPTATRWHHRAAQAQTFFPPEMLWEKKLHLDLIPNSVFSVHSFFLILINWALDAYKNGVIDNMVTQQFPFLWKGLILKEGLKNKSETICEYMQSCHQLNEPFVSLPDQWQHWVVVTVCHWVSDNRGVTTKRSSQKKSR